MENIIGLTLLILLLIAGINETVLAQNSSLPKTREYTENLSFEVYLKRDNHLLFEPVFVKFKVLNKSEKVIRLYRPEFLHDTTLKVIKPNGQVQQINRLSTSSGRGLPLPDTISLLQPYQEYKSYPEEELPTIDPSVFAEPGQYKLQFTLTVGESKLKSNIVEVNYKMPKGADKEAFDYLIKYKSNISFYWIWEEKNGKELLKDFVDKYGQTVYGEYGIQVLGNVYRAEGNIDKAKIEFEKLVSSQNEYIAESAKKSLEEIKKKKRRINKAKKALKSKRLKKYLKK